MIKTNKLCGSCVYYEHDENLNQNEGHCNNPIKFVYSCCYWKSDNGVLVKKPVVFADSSFCLEFEGKESYA